MSYYGIIECCRKNTDIGEKKQILWLKIIFVKSVHICTESHAQGLKGDYKSTPCETSFTKSPWNRIKVKN